MRLAIPHVQTTQNIPLASDIASPVFDVVDVTFCVRQPPVLCNINIFLQLFSLSPLTLCPLSSALLCCFQTPVDSGVVVKQCSSRCNANLPRNCAKRIIPQTFAETGHCRAICREERRLFIDLTACQTRGLEFVCFDVGFGADWETGCNLVQNLKILSAYCWYKTLVSNKSTRN